MNDEIVTAELHAFFEDVTKYPFTIEDLTAWYDVVCHLEMLFIILGVEDYPVNEDNVVILLEMAFPGRKQENGFWKIAPRYAKTSEETRDYFRNARTRIRQMYIDLALKAI